MVGLAGVKFITGTVLTVTVMVDTPEQAGVVPVMVYTVVTVGVATTELPVVVLNPVAGDQV